MSQIPFLSPSYQGRSTNVDATRCVNFFPEVPQSPFTKSPITLVGTPGVKPYINFGTDPVRMLHVFQGLLFTVVGDTCYATDVNRTVSAPLFTLATTEGRISVEDNGIRSNGVGGNQMLLIDGVYGYLYNISTNTMLRSDAFTGANSTGLSAFPVGPSQLTYMDGYFIVTNNTMNFYVSDLYDGSSWGGLASAGAVAASDSIQIPYNLHQELYMIKEYTTEIFYDAGVATTQGCPFVLRSGAVLDFGTPSPWSVARGAGSLFFLANLRSSEVGEFVGVVQLQGYQPNVISPDAITYRMSKFSLHDAFGYSYSDEGHTFYVLTFPTDNATFVYDASNQMWHERSTYVSGNPYQVNRHLSNVYAKYAEKHIVGDFDSGNLYEMSNSITNDDGQPIVSFVVSPYQYDKNEMENIFISKLVVDAETGIGTDTYTIDTSNIATANGTYLANGSIYAGWPPLYVLVSSTSDPQALLAWSDDGGHTWSNEYQASLGMAGQYGKRLVWRRLGRSRNKIFRLAMPGDHKKILINAFIEGSV